jgi:methyl-accepting chemotaxis protein
MKKSKEKKDETGLLSVFENLTLKNKMVLMLIIPILALVFFVQSEMRQSMSLVTENDIILTQFSVKVSTITYELQKEHGAPSSYLGSGSIEIDG